MTPREELQALVEGLSAAAVPLSDAAMDAPYAWGEYDEDGLRFALLTAYHELRDLAFRLDDAREAPTAAQRIMRGFIAANADLHGALAPASDAEFELAPGPDQWPLREVLQHCLRTNAGFLWAARRGIGLMTEGKGPQPIEDWSQQPPAPSLDGTRAEAVSRVLASRDEVLAALSGLSDDQLEWPSYFWESEPFPLRFRLVRFELHLRQHTIQGDKTMAAIGHPPSEAERLCRLLWQACGDVEGALLGTPAGFGDDLVSAASKALSGLKTSVEQAG